MGSVDEGTDIRVKFDEVALHRIQVALQRIPCVDCGYLTKFFCNLCLGDRFIPLCPRCEIVNLQCHFCRGEDWCDLPGTWNHNSVIKHMLRPMLPDQGYRPIAIGALKDEKLFFQDREKKWDPVLQEYVFRVELQPTENARPSSSSTEAASGDLHTCD
jgi:hypothetical protein